MASQKNTNLLPSDYGDLLQTIKQQIRQSRIQAYRAVNKGMIELYWNIGREIASRQEQDGWGRSVVERLSKDLQEEFPGVTGFSARNLWDMRRFYTEYRDAPNLRQLVAEIPWGKIFLFYHRKDARQNDQRT